jgi:predicted transcriptional regulator
MSKSLPTLQDSTTKREQIIKLLSEGNHSTKNIARMVGTTEAYVWKEKSKLKTSGLLITRDTEVISRRSHESLSVKTSPVIEFWEQKLCLVINT